MAIHHRSTVRVLAWAALAAALPLTLPLVVHADPALAGDFQPFVGQVTGDDVLARSGPTEGFYATSKLNKGDRVTVVGIRGVDNDYLKVVPPDGSFCYVAKAFVELQPGNGTAGKVTRSDLIVRAGSTLNNKMNTMLMKLDAGDAVQLIGPQDDGKYFKIVPPSGAYLYVKRSLVSPVPNGGPVSVPLAAQANDREPIASDPAAPATPPAVAARSAVVTPPPPPAAVEPAPQPPVQPKPPVAVAPAQPLVPATPPAAAVPAAPPAVALATPTTKPADPGNSAAVASAQFAAPATTRPTSVVALARPTTRPTLTAREQFDRAETEFARISKLPLEKQPLDGLKWRYKTLASNATLPASLRQVSQDREDALVLRIDARNQTVEDIRSATEAAARQRALTSEQEELSQRVKEQQVATYTALGTLRMSSLQQSGPTLYRLTDPNTGRTVIYIRSSDARYADLLNQFIGVRGQITQDATMSLRYVTPTEVEPVDVAKVNNGISAAVTPPSLMPKSATVSIGG